MEQIEKRLGAVVRRLADEHGLSINALARESGETYSTVRRYFWVGNRDIGLEVLQHVADAFGISLSELFRRAEAAEPEPWPTAPPRGKGVVAITGRKGKGGNGIRKIGGGSDDSPSGPLTIV